ncbi:DUF488 domain-containing protein [Ursidibacter maritimus]|uniref:DUF488 domain-containing protein n=1 Tax=Ursidibacter maritimus TaxID=1331689 RepID=A0A949T258_9PAST|nr:hypothetical protein A1D26_02755 [Ursidibacter maritimus]MBV6528438.1 DUF488 domain-containing protein [Ursidibacter maritimus]MBV6530543.1 DUF488 domain-containing protein [Ursidibacter maritimus]MBV6534130.1 DUF488 domain-containing protein [Ursidibacter maritimus]MBV6534236.1 DUF488 domain-containing protein [Ursidibacter maritimus]
MNINTIGFTEKSAEQFFELLRNSNTNLLIDVRINNSSQLSGFAKKNDLKFFLKELCSIDYIHMPELAPTNNLLKLYRSGDISWKQYEDSFLNLMAKRRIEKLVNNHLLENGCLLCSEHKPHYCHRRLVIEYLNKEANFNLSVKHLY